MGPSEFTGTMHGGNAPVLDAPQITVADNPSTVEAALRTVDRALDSLCATLGLTAIAA